MKLAPIAPTPHTFKVISAAFTITTVSLAVSLLAGATEVKAISPSISLSSTASLPGTKADETSLPQLNGSPASTITLPITPFPTGPITPFPTIAPPETPLPAVIETPLPDAIETTTETTVETTVPPLQGSGVIAVDTVQPTSTVLSFRTRNYTVRVTGSPGNYFMSLFNRRTSRQEFRNVPAIAVQPGVGTNYPGQRTFTAKQGDLTYTAYDDRNGTTTLLIVPPELDED